MKKKIMNIFNNKLDMVALLEADPHQLKSTTRHNTAILNLTFYIVIFSIFTLS